MPGGKSCRQNREIIMAVFLSHKKQKSGEKTHYRLFGNHRGLEMGYTPLRRSFAEVV